MHNSFNPSLRHDIETKISRTKQEKSRNFDLLFDHANKIEFAGTKYLQARV